MTPVKQKNKGLTGQAKTRNKAKKFFPRRMAVKYKRLSNSNKNDQPT
jgi:hypothetical protein